MLSLPLVPGGRVVNGMEAEAQAAHRCPSPLLVPAPGPLPRPFSRLCGASRITVKSADVVRHVPTEFGLIQSDY